MGIRRWRDTRGNDFKDNKMVGHRKTSLKIRCQDNGGNIGEGNRMVGYQGTWNRRQEYGGAKGN